MTEYFEVPEKLKVYSVLSKLYNECEDVRNIPAEDLFGAFRAGTLSANTTFKYLNEVFKEYSAGNALPLNGLISKIRSREITIPGRLVMYVDTETSGLSNRDKVIQLAYIVKYYQEDLAEEIFRYNEYVNVNVSIHWAAAKVHGISNDVLLRHGKCPEKVYTTFDKVSKICDNIVAFNMSFDYRMIENSLPIGLTLTSCKWKCAMKDAKSKGHSGKLNDIYKSITGGYIVNAHDALADVLAMITVYEHLN